MDTETGKRIFWDEEEKEKLADEVHRLIQLDPTGAIVSIVEKAQDSVLPPNRHRNCAIQGLPWLEEALMYRFRQANHERGKKDEKIEALQKKIEGFKEQLETVPTRDDLIEEHLDSMDATELLVRYIQKQGEQANALLFRLERIEGFIYNSLQEVLTASGKAALKSPEKRKLVFVGLSEHEIASVKLDFDKYANLKFVASSMPIMNYPTECGQIFISRKGVSTPLRDKLLASKQDVCTVVNGGVVKLRKAIWDYLKAK
jgi:hypothetical protein